MPSTIVPDGEWSLLSCASDRSAGVASTQTQGHEEMSLVDARWHPSSLHQLGRELSSGEVPGQSDQSRRTHHLASSLPGFESIGFQFLKKVHQEHPETIESLIDCVKSFPEIHDSSVLG